MIPIEDHALHVQSKEQKENIIRSMICRSTYLSRVALDLPHLLPSPKECVMIGNDVGEDMIAAKLGMKVFLLTDCLINRKNEDISAYPHGSFDELLVYIEKWREEE